MRKAIFHMEDVPLNDYEKDLQKLNGNMVIVKADNADENGIYEVEFSDGSSYDVYERELTMQ